MHESGFCRICIDAIPNWPENHSPSHFANSIFAGRTPITKLQVLSSFHRNSHLQHALHHIKYNGGKALAESLGQLLGQRWTSYFSDDVLICPVPLHPNKLAKRGYNQSLHISRGIQNSAGGSVLPLLSRTVETPTQTSLNREERWKNVESAFKVESGVRNRIILLVDDTLTTGATIEACSLQLFNSGAREVWAAALGYAP